MWVHGYGAFPPFPFFPFFPLFPIALLALVAFVVLRWGRWGHGGRFDRAMAVLRERYARGEIDAEEYRSRKEELMGR